MCIIKAMDTYTYGAGKASRVVTETFSHSFSSAIGLLDQSIRQDIYNIYGLVRVADEIVDSYQGKDAEKLLNDLEQDVYQTLGSGFSANIIVHSFCNTAMRYDISRDLIDPFFESMRTDLTKKSFTVEEYQTYIYGSAEVVGLMCLKVFTHNTPELYDKLKTGASALGAAYQKVNFLRDIKDDLETRGRFYFPNCSYGNFDDNAKREIIDDIKKDLALAENAVKNLPKNARFATQLSCDYYEALLSELEKIPASTLKERRVSVNKWLKFQYFLRARAGQYVG